MSEFICSRCENSFSCEATDMERVVCPYCGVELTIDSACDILPEGFTINGFEIVRLLASGSSGRVYLANQVAVERLVAIKILKRSLAEKKEAAERFINEARNAAKFQYPNIVTTLEAGNADGFYYIAMQYVRGETLEKLLDEGKIFSEAEALGIVLKIAAALQQIWEKHRMFHKDIKPANIMLDSDNEAMLLDMGIARELSRINLPLSIYTEFYWEIDLHNLFHFLALRLDGHAQYEIREYAKIMLEIVRKVCPIATEAFENHKLRGRSFSGRELDALKAMLRGEECPLEKREREIFEEKLR